MKLRTIAAGTLVTLAAFGGSVAAQHSPIAQAAAPTLFVGAVNQAISVTGTNFSTSGRAVTLRVWGLVSGKPTTLLSTVFVTPRRKAGTPPCLIICSAGSFWVETGQPQNPCPGNGFMAVKVMAWTTGPRGVGYLAASASAQVSCQIIQ